MASNRPPSSCNQPCENDGADDSPEQAGTLARAVPTERLPEIGGDERSNDPQEHGHNEPGRFVVTGHQELDDDTSRSAGSVTAIRLCIVPNSGT